MPDRGVRKVCESISMRSNSGTFPITHVICVVRIWTFPAALKRNRKAAGSASGYTLSPKDSARRSFGMRIANGVELAKYSASVTGESSGRGIKMANSAGTGAEVRVGADASLLCSDP